MDQLPVTYVDFRFTYKHRHYRIEWRKPNIWYPEQGENDSECELTYMVNEHKFEYIQNFHPPSNDIPKMLILACEYIEEWLQDSE